MKHLKIFEQFITEHVDEDGMNYYDEKRLVVMYSKSKQKMFVGLPGNKDYNMSVNDVATKEEANDIIAKLLSVGPTDWINIVGDDYRIGRDTEYFD